MKARPIRVLGLSLKKCQLSLGVMWMILQCLKGTEDTSLGTRSLKNGTTCDGSVFVIPVLQKTDSGTLKSLQDQPKCEFGPRSPKMALRCHNTHHSATPGELKPTTHFGHYSIYAGG